MPLYRKLPHRGFNNYEFRTEIAIVNVGDLARLDSGRHRSRRGGAGRRRSHPFRRDHGQGAGRWRADPRAEGLRRQVLRRRQNQNRGRRRFRSSSPDANAECGIWHADLFNPDEPGFIAAFPPPFALRLPPSEFKMFSAFTNSLKIPELRSRIIYTLALLFVARVGAHIPLPGIDPQPLEDFFKTGGGVGGGIMSLYNMFTGGALNKGAVCALGIMPYISASDHFPAHDGGGSVLQPAAAGGRRGPAEAHPIHPLRHGAHLCHPGRAADPRAGESRPPFPRLRPRHESSSSLARRGFSSARCFSSPPVPCC